MKKLRLLLFVLLLPMAASAETVEIDDIYYELVLKAKQAIVKFARTIVDNFVNFDNFERSDNFRNLTIYNFKTIEI